MQFDKPLRNKYNFYTHMHHRHTIHKKNKTKMHPNHWGSACSGQALWTFEGNLYFILRLLGCQGNRPVYNYFCEIWNNIHIYPHIIIYSISHSSTRYITFITIYPYVHPNIPTSNNSITISHLYTQNIFFQPQWSVSHKWKRQKFSSLAF